MNLQKLGFKLFYGIVIATILINIIVYQYLPNRVGMQITLSGRLDNYVPKFIFVIIAPLILIASTVLAKNLKEEYKKVLLVNIVIFIANIIMILANI
ncbi:DUF1648 domain-containing protein [Thermohalobacter berrensis]|uniref:DUF1648 domain-containing protein n=1 Tax=Thermohalobacter berrensis TaxID=99594 RepID=A0A419SZ84_9FIRM|nr:DUF1648 domain-containing protein [Thermohalobacter berrensis]RKD30515.1 hypothetical protein BET03_04035 [Thermohalobacter berrensis]